MLKLRINPLVVKDLKEIRDFIADDNPDKAAETIDNIYKTFENVQQFPGLGADLSKRVSVKPPHLNAMHYRWGFPSISNKYYLFCHFNDRDSLT